MDRGQTKNRLLIAEAIAFSLIFGSIWADEVIDLPHLIFGIGASPISWGDAILECAFIAFIGAIIMFMTWKLGSSGNNELASKQVITVCAVCRKVNRNGQWITLDEFIGSGTSGSFTHGICPECMETYYKGVTDTTAFNFRQHLKKPKDKE